MKGRSTLFVTSISKPVATVDPQGVRAQVEKVTMAGPRVSQETGEELELVERSNVDLGSELVEMTLNSTMYRANLKTIKTINEMTGELLKIKS